MLRGLMCELSLPSLETETHVYMCAAILRPVYVTCMHVLTRAISTIGWVCATRTCRLSRCRTWIATLTKTAHYTLDWKTELSTHNKKDQYWSIHHRIQHRVSYITMKPSARHHFYRTRLDYYIVTFTRHICTLFSAYIGLCTILYEKVVPCCLINLQCIN